MKDPTPRNGNKEDLPSVKIAAKNRNMKLSYYSDEKGDYDDKGIDQLVDEMMPFLLLEEEKRKVEAAVRKRQRDAKAARDKAAAEEEKEVSIQLFMYVYMSRNRNTSHITYSS